MGFDGSGLGCLTDIVFGGTFDPPHEGHRLIAERVLAEWPSAQLWIIPGKAPAGAHGQHKVPSASFEQRLAMCAITFAPRSGAEPGVTSRLRIDPIEGQLPDPNYTLNTLRALVARQAEARWGLLMGRDQIASFAGWYQPRQILEMASLVVADRETDEDLDPVIQRLGTSLGLTPERKGAHTWQWHGLDTGIYWLKGCVSAAASRTIRTDWAHALKSQWISPQMAQYINEQGLYRQKEA